MNIEHKKIELIQEIAATEEADFLAALEAVVKQFKRPLYKLDFSKHPNIKDQVVIEQLKLERPTIPLDPAEFARQVSRLEWNESIEELLAQLKDLD